MPGTITQTFESRGPVGVVTLTATGDAADGSFPSTDLSTKISGFILALETNPGSPAPTDNYDIVLNDADGHDVLEGKGANRDTANTEKVQVVDVAEGRYPPVAAGDTLSLVITNSTVNSAVIVIKIYFLGQKGT